MITVTGIYDAVAANISAVKTGIITPKQCRDRIRRLARNAATIGVAITNPSTAELRKLVPVTEPAPVETYAASEPEPEPETSYEESYTSSSCW